MRLRFREAPAGAVARYSPARDQTAQAYSSDRESSCSGSTDRGGRADPADRAERSLPAPRSRPPSDSQPGSTAQQEGLARRMDRLESCCYEMKELLESMAEFLMVKNRKVTASFSFLLLNRLRDSHVRVQRIQDVLRSLTTASGDPAPESDSESEGDDDADVVEAPPPRSPASPKRKPAPRSPPSSDRKSAPKEPSSDRKSAPILSSRFVPPLIVPTA